MNISNYSDLAWFNLSENIKRKEREKALFSFRLLSHSIENENFKLQLLADLYFFLEENDQAFLLYKEIFDKYFFNNDIYGIFSILNRLSFYSNDLNYFIKKIEELKNNKKLNNFYYLEFLNNILKKSKIKKN